jgi:hypothetical protein
VRAFVGIGAAGVVALAVLQKIVRELQAEGEVFKDVRQLPKETSDEGSLRGDVTFVYSLHLSLADNVHHLIALQCVVSKLPSLMLRKHQQKRPLVWWGRVTKKVGVRNG